MANLLHNRFNIPYGFYNYIYGIIRLIRLYSACNTAHFILKIRENISQYLADLANIFTLIPNKNARQNALKVERIQIENGVVYTDILLRFYLIYY